MGIGKKDKKHSHYERKDEIERNARWISKFEALQPFNGDVTRVPPLPVMARKVYKESIMPHLIRCGAIPKNSLTVGKKYIGFCKNTTEATWDGNQFVYYKNNFGMLTKCNIQHFEDFVATEVFIPIVGRL